MTNPTISAKERAEHIEALGPPTYKDKTLWFRSDKVLARIRQAEQAAYERAARHLDMEALSYGRVGDKMEKRGKPEVANEAYNSGALYEHAASAIRALAQQPEEVE